MIRVEVLSLLRRRRTWVTLLLLDALPTLVAILLAITDLGPRPGEGPPFLSAVLGNGALYPAAAIALVLPIFLPVAVAVVAGEAIAGEAQAGTLRYLLIRPVSRTRLLVAKLASVIVFTFLAVLVIAGTAYVVGTALLGTGPVPAISGGAALSPAQVALRTGATIGFVAVSMLGVAAVALLLSTVTDSPLVAALVAIAVLVTSALLVTLDAAAAVRPYLPTRYWLAFVDLFRNPILWRDIIRGLALQAVYVVVLLGAAWANFTSKDITS